MEPIYALKRLKDVNSGCNGCVLRNFILKRSFSFVDFYITSEKPF